MLCLSRKKNEQVCINGAWGTVTVLEIQGDKVKLGFEFPKEVPVHRKEVQEVVDREGPRV